MKNLIHLITVMAMGLFFNQSAIAQTIITFEDLELGVDTFWNGIDQSGGFMSQDVFFPNHYVTDFGGYWAGGWALSSRTDVEDASFMNLYSAVTGMGREESQQYVVGQQGTTIDLSEALMEGQQVTGLYLTNTTYAHGVIRDGNMFSEKFGGESGNDPDFFKLTIKKWKDGVIGTDSVEFYLADYRFEDNSMDYIVDTWEWVDLTALGEMDSLMFQLTSTDNNDNGMLTPAFFGMDDLTIDEISSTKKAVIGNVDLAVFPNPTTEFVTLDWSNITTDAANISIFDINGRMFAQWEDVSSSSILKINHLPKGIYTVRLEMETFYTVKRLMVK